MRALREVGWRGTNVAYQIFMSYLVQTDSRMTNSCPLRRRWGPRSVPKIANWQLSRRTAGPAHKQTPHSTSVPLVSFVIKHTFGYLPGWLNITNCPTIDGV